MNTLITAYQTTTNSFIHLQIFIEPYYVPGTILAAGDTKLLNFSEREMRSTDAQRKQKYIALFPEVTCPELEVGSICSSF